MSWARIVAVVALAWNLEARVPAALVRLNAIAARTVQALFAANDPERIGSRATAERSVAATRRSTAR
jgi:hypothetical protein